MLLAVLSAAAYASLEWVIRSNETYSSVINISGRQRMLPQRIVFLSSRPLTAGDTAGLRGPYTATPVAYDAILYGVREGILFAYDMKTGARLYRERTNATHAASLVASDGKIYVPSEDGEVLVARAGRSFALLARQNMGESCMATPAISAGTLYLRTTGNLYAISDSSLRAGDPQPGGPGLHVHAAEHASPDPPPSAELSRRPSVHLTKLGPVGGGVAPNYKAATLGGCEP